MKKDINKEEPTIDRQRKEVHNYFTPEIVERITEMTTKQMENLLKEFATTDYWIALIKYNEMRLPLLDSYLRGTNPHADPHKISWAQGCMAGICDLENYVIEINKPKEEEKEEK